jgi:hypothetical protein
MVLDGNVYSEQYYNGLVTNQPDNADEAVRSFFEYCAEAGQEECAFAGNDTQGEVLTTSKQLEERYINLLKKLEKEPLLALDGPFPNIITHTDIQRYAFSAAYAPSFRFPEMAKALAELDFGNSTFFQIINSGTSIWAQSEEEPRYAVPNPSYSDGEGLMLITCVDVAGRSPIKSFEDYLSAYNDLTSSSVYGGRVLALANAVLCAGVDLPQPDSQIFPGKS